MKLRFKLAIVFLLLLGMGFAMFHFAQLACPISKGNSAAFWKYACGVNLNGDSDKRSGWGHGTYPPIDGWYSYYDQNFHGQRLYRVPSKETEADFPDVVKCLEKKPTAEMSPCRRAGFEAWKKLPEDRQDAQELLSQIHQAEIESWQKEHEEQPESKDYLLERDEEFKLRWERIQRYWLTGFFEFMIFAFLILFAAYPWLRRSSLLRWSLHYALLPILLFLPYYMGYAPYTFTSGCPGGAILYPYGIVWFCHCPLTQLDTFLLNHAPQIFEPLNQIPGPWVSLSGMGCPGPTAIILFGLSIGLAVFALGAIGRRILLTRQKWTKTLKTTE